jgi:hypothetical protein
VSSYLVNQQWPRHGAGSPPRRAANSVHRAAPLSHFSSPSAPFLSRHPFLRPFLPPASRPKRRLFTLRRRASYVRTDAARRAKNGPAAARWFPAGAVIVSFAPTTMSPTMIPRRRCRAIVRNGRDVREISCLFPSSKVSLCFSFSFSFPFPLFLPFREFSLAAAELVPETGETKGRAS